MTIKEMEERSGMTRANIRFYEAEGLLSPDRGSNGYRDYSEKDLDTLLRVKLLRTLHISLEEIKEVQQGERELTAVLDSQMERLDQEQKELEYSKEVCQAMRADNVRYDTLNAQKYLEPMEESGSVPTPELKHDTAPRDWIPWRRFLARMFDLSLYAVLWDCFFALTFRRPYALGVTVMGRVSLNFSSIISLVLMILLEPLLLKAFKTTAGKALFGIRVTDENGGRLTYRAGISRTLGALWSGFGFGLPVLDLLRLYKSYKDYAIDYPLSWEYGSELTVKDTKKRRGFAYAAAVLVLPLALPLAQRAAELPKHRGDLTVAEFCDNYNTYLHSYGYDPRYVLNSGGEWVEKPDEMGSVSIYVFGDMVGEQSQPELTFTERDGVMTGLTMELTLENGGDNTWVSSCSMERAMLARSFLLAQKEAGIFDTEARRVVNWIEGTPLESFTSTVCGVDVSCEIEYTGYLENIGGSADMLLPAEGKRSFSLCFSMKLSDE